MIRLEEVSKTYAVRSNAPVVAVAGATMSIDAGEFVIVVGRSGSGKTTLLGLMAGLSRPTTGRVLFDGEDLWTGGDARQARRRGQSMGFVFQSPSLIPFLSVEDNLLLPAGFLGPPDASARSRAQHYLERVGLADKRMALPRQLSAGQQQRAVVARSLVNQPRILFADEPTSNLDERTEQEILDLIADVHANLGVTVVLVTHARQLLSYGTRALEMAEGQISSVRDLRARTGEAVLVT